MRLPDDTIKIDSQELSAIIWVMNKLDSEYLAHGRNGCYLDHYEKKLLTKLRKEQKRRTENRLLESMKQWEVRNSAVHVE